MKINLFGKEMIFEINESKNIKKNLINSNINKKFIFRFIISIIVFFIFGFLLEISNLKTNYDIGTVAQNDIVAYKNVTYFVDLLDKNIQNKIKKNTTPEYDRIKTIENESINSIYIFFQDSKKIDAENNNEIKKFIEQSKLDLTIQEYKEIVSKGDVKYILNLIEKIREIYNIGIVKKEDLQDIFDRNDVILNDLDKKFISNFIKQNMFFNEKRTAQKIESNINALKNKEIKIYKGDIIVKKGSVIDENDYEKLEKLHLVRGGNKIPKTIGMMLTFIMMMSLFYYVLKKFSLNIVTSSVFYPTIITIVIINSIYYFFIKDDLLLYILPFGLIPIMLTILGGKIYALIYTFLNMMIFTKDESWFLVTIAVSIIAIYKADKLNNRSDIVKLGIVIGMFQGVMTLGYGLINQIEIALILVMIVFSVLSGIFTGMLSLALLPYFENSFEILTDIKLVELSDFSHPLLKELLLTAPGTFHHSIMVGALAESAAEKIGANAIFARIASYYHDIGKMKNPEFFVENQKGRENPHNKIKPTLSALIIKSHTKDGHIIGKQYKLPKEILEIILCHHGTTLVQFFYYKALENGEEVVENEFRYSGPKPKSKEAGIILLADTIEAAVRSSEDKSKEGIEKLIRYLIKSKIDDNQLVECSLTLGEIEEIIQAFLNTLQGFYHERIKYPKLDVEEKRRN